MLLTFKTGMLLGLSIIISMGAQNLFLIKQGLRNEYPYLCAFMCFLCDSILIILSTAGVSVLILEFPLLKTILLILGVIFLMYYGSLAIKRGFNAAVISTDLMQLQELKQIKISAVKLIALTLLFSLLNPQAILDVTLIIGGNANHYNNLSKYFFVSGVLAASFIWFFGVAIATRYFGEKISNVKFWRALEYTSGFLMITFAIKFLLPIFR